MNTPSAKPDVLSVQFDSIRNISCKHDTDNGRKVLVGRARASQLLELNTDENVRGYLVDAEGKKKKRKGEVHRKIEDTIENYPENFCVLNGGMVIVARDYSVDEKTKSLSLLKPSVINGAQTQGVLRDCSKGEELDVFVTFELIVTEDESLIAEISIARNFQNDVQNISIAGSRGVLNELEAALQKSDATVKLKKSESERSDEFTDTEKLIQVLMALTPMELLAGTRIGNRESKSYTYSQKATCLKDFSNVYEAQKEEMENGPNRRLYRFYLDIAVQALALYERWKSHQGFQGTGLRSLEREGRQIVEVPDGIVFPILSSLSVFAREREGHWLIQQPTVLSDSELVASAKSAYMQIADSNPQTMGKKSACYTSLLQVTSIYNKLLNQ
jgi:hypothetical protein